MFRDTGNEGAGSFWRFLPAAAVLIVLSLGCKYLSPEQAPISEAADATPVETLDESRVTLNRELAGSLRNPKPLAQKIGEIMKQRSENGVFREGSNDVANDVFVIIDPKTSVGRAAGVFLAINENGGSAIIPYTARDAAKDPKPADPDPHTIDLRNEKGKPNPLTLIVSTGFDLDEDPRMLYISYDTGQPRQSGSIPRFSLLKTRDDLNMARMVAKSIEISSDDNYFLNEKREGSEPGSELLSQRPLAANELRDVIDKIIANEPRPTILASEKASYAALLKILDAVANRRVDFEIRVRPLSLDTPTQSAFTY